MVRKGDATGTRTARDDPPVAPEGAEAQQKEFSSLDELKSLIQDLLQPVSPRLEGPEEPHQPLPK